MTYRLGIWKSSHSLHSYKYFSFSFIFISDLEICSKARAGITKYLENCKLCHLKSQNKKNDFWNSKVCWDIALTKAITLRKMFDKLRFDLLFTVLRSWIKILGLVDLFQVVGTQTAIESILIKKWFLNDLSTCHSKILRNLR